MIILTADIKRTSFVGEMGSWWLPNQVSRKWEPRWEHSVMLGSEGEGYATYRKCLVDDQEQKVENKSAQAIDRNHWDFICSFKVGSHYVAY